MINFKRLGLLCSGTWLLVGCMVGGTPPPAPVPTAMPLSGETIDVYIGQLGSELDLVAVLVGATQVRAVVCVEDPDLWSSINAWLGTGTINLEQLRAENSARGITLTGKVVNGQIEGQVATKTGITLPFTAPRIATSADYANNERRGVYLIRKAITPYRLDVQFYAVLAVDQLEGAIGCGMIFSQEGEPLSRLFIRGAWADGLTTFVMLDNIDAKGLPIVWAGPGMMGRVERIGAK